MPAFGLAYLFREDELFTIYEFLMSETKVYAILTAGYDRKERMEGRILGEELELEVCSVLRKIREDM